MQKNMDSRLLLEKQRSVLPAAPCPVRACCHLASISQSWTVATPVESTRALQLVTVPTAPRGSLLDSPATCQVHPSCAVCVCFMVENISLYFGPY